MADNANSKEGMEKLLARGLRRGLDASGKDCPDAETLAAYFDRHLNAGETQRLELHFSSCARCQEQLAALVCTETVTTTAAARAPIRFWDWRWMAPLATAAAAFAIWIAIKPAAPLNESASARPAETAVAVNRQPATLADQQGKDAALPKSAPPAASDKAGLMAESNVVAKPKAAPAPREADALTKSATGRAAQVSPLPAAPSQDRGTYELKRQDERLQAQQKATEEPYRTAQAAAPSDQAKKMDQVTVATPPATPEREKGRETAQVAGKKEEAAKESRAQVGRLNSALALRTRELLVIAPGGKVVWRYTTESGLERSSDSGASWTSQFEPEHAVLAGVCLSEKLCWMAGRSGMVLRTTDGKEWESSTRPTSSDLTSVAATDASTATVTAADGKRFRTTDGGKTWKSAD